MKIREIDLAIVQGTPAGVTADMRAGLDGRGAEGAGTDEQTARMSIRRLLRESVDRKLVSIALSAPAAPGGLSAAAWGKIFAQEAIRAARQASSLRSISLHCDNEQDYVVLEKTVTGYVRHFIDTLQWGPLVTVDAIIEVLREGIVLIKRSNPPFGYALPGGFVDYGESLEDAVRREAREETGLALSDIEQFHTYSSPERDPRFHTITTVFSARAAGAPKAGDDAAEIAVVDLDKIGGLPFAFDHRQVLQDYVARRARASVTAAPRGIRPVDPPGTLG